MKIKLDEFQKSIIKDFWKWVRKHDVDVEWRGNNLYMWVESEHIKSFGEEFEIQDDYTISCELMCINTLCIKVKDILGGHGFGMEKVLKKERESK